MGRYKFLRKCLDVQLPYFAQPATMADLLTLTHTEEHAFYTKCLAPAIYERFGVFLEGKHHFGYMGRNVVYFGCTDSRRVYMEPDSTFSHLDPEWAEFILVYLFTVRIYSNAIKQVKYK